MQFSTAEKALFLKIVYYGPGLGGKTTNLELIHARTKPELRGKLISLATESERTLFFDLLPVELGKFKGYDIRLHLCTVPGQIAQEQTRRLVLRHVDGIVFVVDSQPSRLEENVESIRNLETNLMMQGDDPDRMPLVVQYNKRDLPTAVSIEEMDGGGRHGDTHRLAYTDRGATRDAKGNFGALGMRHEDD